MTNFEQLVSNLVNAAIAESRERRGPTQDYQRAQDLAKTTNDAVDALERATVNFALECWAKKVGVGDEQTR